MINGLVNSNIKTINFSNLLNHNSHACWSVWRVFLFFENIVWKAKINVSIQQKNTIRNSRINHSSKQIIPWYVTWHKYCLIFAKNYCTFPWTHSWRFFLNETVSSYWQIISGAMGWAHGSISAPLLWGLYECGWYDERHNRGTVVQLYIAYFVHLNALLVLYICIKIHQHFCQQ